MMYVLFFILLSCTEFEGKYAIDDDSDGFSEFDGDCNDQDSRVNPKEPEICDAVDNNCNGEVDEDLTGCIPEISLWTHADGTPERHCHYRNIRGQNAPIELEPDPSVIYQLGSLTIDEGVKIYIRKSNVQSEYPGYLPDHNTVASNAETLDSCLSNDIGGRLRLRAREITIEKRGLLSAGSASDVTCATRLSEGA